MKVYYFDVYFNQGCKIFLYVCAEVSLQSPVTGGFTIKVASDRVIR